MPFSLKGAYEGAKGAAMEGLKGFSQASTASAFESFGKAMGGGGYTPRGQMPDQSHMTNWRRMGQKTQDALENRWHRAEFSQFRKNEVAEFETGLNSLKDKSKYLSSELMEGRWHHGPNPEDVEILDMNDEKTRMRILRLKSQLEAETLNYVTEATLRLNASAMEKYGNNPIVGAMIEKMMMGQTEMIQRQFNPGQSTRANAMGENEVAMGDADIQYKKAMTGQVKAQTSTVTDKYKSIAVAHSSMSPSEFVEYATNNVEGRALLADSTYSDYLSRIEIQTRRQFRANKDWDDEQAATGPNMKLEQEYIDLNMPEYKQRALGDFIQGEFGDAALKAAGEYRPGLIAEPSLRAEYDVKVMPSKDDVEEKVTDWNTLGVEIANEKMRQDRDLTKEDALDWLMDEWFPKAMDGTDIVSGGGIKQLDGLTADATNGVVKPYIEKVRKALEKYAKKWIGTGEGTSELLESQRSTPHRRKGGRGGALGRTASSFIDAITPGDGPGLYPDNFRKRHPKEE